MKIRYVGLLIVLIQLTSCFDFVYYDQKEVILEGIDIDATLKIARIELEEGGMDAVLTIWAMRDQVITAGHARIIDKLYFDHIETIADQKNRDSADFGVWHLAWAISNLYRNGDEQVKEALSFAYQDAINRPGQLKKFVKIAEEHINGDRIYMGDIHDLGRSYAKSHLVVPGNKEYIQSFEEFFEENYHE